MSCCGASFKPILRFVSVPASKGDTPSCAAAHLALVIHNTRCSNNALPCAGDWIRDLRGSSLPLWGFSFQHSSPLLEIHHRTQNMRSERTKRRKLKTQCVSQIMDSFNHENVHTNGLYTRCRDYPAYLWCVANNEPHKRIVARTFFYLL